MKKNLFQLSIGIENDDWVEDKVTKDAEVMPGRSAPFAVGSDTSRAAAESIFILGGSLRFSVLELIVKSEFEGITCDEIEEDLSMSHQTASARVNEIVGAGFAIDSGHRRRTRSGRAARVLIASDEGKVALMKAKLEE